MRKFVIAALLTILTACGGWHLRGIQPMPSIIQVVAIEPNEPYTPLQRNLRSALTISKVGVVDISQNPSAIILLKSERLIKSTTALGSDGETKENDLTYRVIFSVKTLEGDFLIPETTVESTGRVRYDPDALLSQNNEQRLMEGEIRRDVVDQIMRRLANIPETPPESTEAPANNETQP